MYEFLSCRTLLSFIDRKIKNWKRNNCFKIKITKWTKHCSYQESSENNCPKQILGFNTTIEVAEEALPFL